MNVLLVSGSPRRDGNSEKALKFSKDFLLNKGATVNSFLLSSNTVGFCTACDFCKTNPNCVRNDDFSKFFELALDADVIIVFSPVYFGNVTSQLKALFDRSRVLRKNFLLKNKVGYGVALGHSRNGGQETTLGAIHNWMMIQGMNVKGDMSHYGCAIVDEFELDVIGKNSLLRLLESLF